MRRRSKTGAGALCLAVLALGGLATLAVARPIFGTKADDVLNGTDRHDIIAGRSGNDTVNAGEGNDLVFGGLGDDLLNGDAGNDRIFAQRGVDTVNGGPGNDNLWSLARADVTGDPNEPADTLSGGPGNDVFHVRDGEPDHVDCGEGFDVVSADYKDVVANNCETVKRHVPRPMRTKDDS